MYQVNAMYVCMVCFASNSLQLICNQCCIIVFSGMCLAVDIPSNLGADFEVLVPHIPFVRLVINAHAVARLIVDALFVDCSGI